MVEQKISFDTNPGIQALRALNNAIDLYNTKLGSLGKKQAALEIENERLKESFEQNADRIVEVETALEALDSICRAATTSHANFSQSATNASTALIVLNQAAAANTVNTQQNVAAINAQAEALNRDAAAAEKTVKTYTGLSVTVAQLDLRMLGKNKTIQQQKRLFDQEAQTVQTIIKTYAALLTLVGQTDTRLASANKAIGFQGQLMLEDKSAMEKTSIVLAKIPTFYQRILKEANSKNKALKEQVTATNQDTNALLRLTYVANATPAKVRRLAKEIQYLNLNLGFMHGALTRAAHILFNFLGYGTLFRVFNEATESVSKAYEFAKAISEIRTISDRGAKSTNQWSQELISLSNALGVDVLEAAEAGYQALSNQVVEATDTISFLRTEMVTAYTTVADLSDVVEATTGILNAWQESSAAATRVNAVLFKTVEEGRVRMDEMANTLGRVSILSSRLNITLTEQQAALSQLTKLGLKYDEAVTAMRNVQLKLIKPSEKMTEILDKWGFSSGAAAVKALGFTGVMRKLYLETLKSKDATAEMGDIFQELRATIGGLGLTQSDLTKEFTLYASALDDNFAALLERLQSLDVRANKQIQRFKNTLLEAFGKPTLKILVEFSEWAGGLDAILVRVAKAFRLGVEALLAYKVAFAATSSVVFLLTKTQLPFLIRQLGILRGAIVGVRLALTSVNGIAALATAGLTILGTVFLEKILSKGDDIVDITQKTEAFKATLENLGTVELERVKVSLGKDVFEMEASLNRITQKFATYVAKLRVLNNATFNAVDFDNAIKEFEKFSKSIEKDLDKPLDKITQKINKLENSIDNLKESVETEQIKLNVDTELRDINSDVTQLREFYQALFEQAIAETDLGLAEILAEQADRVLGELRSKLEEMNKIAEEQRKQRIEAAKEDRREELADRQAALNDWLNQSFAIDENRAANKSKLRRQGRKFIEAQVPEVQDFQEDEVKLQEELKGLEEQRLTNQQRFIDRKREIIGLQEKETEALRKQQAEQQAAVLELQAIFDEINKLKGEELDATAVGRLGNLRERALAIGVSAGLSMDKQFEIIQQIADFELETRKALEQKVNEDKLKRGQDLIDKLAKAQDQARKDFEDKSVKALEFQKTELPKLLGGDVNKMLEVVKKIEESGRFGHIDDLFNPLSPITLLKQKLETYVKQQSPLTEEQINALKEQVAQVKELFAGFDDFDQTFEQVLNFSDFLKKEVGPRGVEITTFLGEDIEAIQKRFDVALKAIEEANSLSVEAQNSLDIFTTAEEQLRAYLESLPQDMLNFVNQADELLDQPIQSTQEWADKLKEVKQLLEDVRNANPGGGVVPQRDPRQNGNQQPTNETNIKIEKIEINPRGRATDAEVNELFFSLQRLQRQGNSFSRTA